MSQDLAEFQAPIGTDHHGLAAPGHLIPIGVEREPPHMTHQAVAHQICRTVVHALPVLRPRAVFDSPYPAIPRLGPPFIKLELAWGGKVWASATPFLAQRLARRAVFHASRRNRAL